MKYILIIPDGAADEPIEEQGGKTAFELAATPAMDRIAREGRLGRALTVPEGCKPGSDVANLSLFGYDPRVGFNGRAALEAASLDITVPEGDAVFRANLVTVSPEHVMVDYSAGHISTEEGREIIEHLQKELDVDGITLHPGVGYRHICLMENAGSSVPECTPPHDIVGEDITEHLPQGQFSSWVLEVERASAEIMPNLDVNKKRVEDGKNPATQLWLWGGATAMTLSNFAERHGLGSAGLITAVDLLRGIGKLAGMDVIDVPGATAYLDTNFADKGRAALDYIYMHDFIAVHIEAPDEAGHIGDLAGKVKALEDIDRHIIAPLLAMANYYGDWRILVAPDHPTPVGTGKHSSTPVPYAMWGPGIEPNGAKAFNEREAERVGGDTVDGIGLMDVFITSAGADSGTADGAAESGASGEDVDAAEAALEDLVADVESGADGEASA
ncbi:MAG: cofactor-independent phosphoglycerate mutase [Planctomycetaceae bacterium]|nr:cofactor-independent phosphoglycerate mutase [Planctomycetaceae bacterium]